MTTPSLIPARATAQRALLSLAPLLLSAALSAQQFGSVRGRVLDEATRQPIVGVEVRVHDTEISTLSGPDGSFVLPTVPVGSTVVYLTHLGYGEHLRVVTVRDGAETPLQVRLPSRPIALPEVVAQGRTELDERRLTSGFAINEIRREAIDRSAQMGLNLGQLLQQEMLGVRVRGSCVEYRGSGGFDDGLCREVSVFIDGVPVTAPSTLYNNMPLNDIERLEVLSPGEAGAQYGSVGGWGVLMIETRRGTRPDRPRNAQDELVFGFDWEAEQRSYRWARVVGGSVLGNALGLGLSLAAAEKCFEVRQRGVLGVHKRCRGILTMAAGMLTLSLPSLAGSYAARWGGATDRSQGRILPGLVMGTISAATGYLLLVRGESLGSDGMATAGAVILTVGTPALLILSDRTLRVLR
jgi:hypothetical protein